MRRFAKRTLKTTTGEMRRKRRVRQHVNPLADKFQAGSGEVLKKWIDIPFSNRDRDVILDLGCAKAKYLRELASLNDENINYLGIEIREEVADYVNCKAKEENVDGNLYVIGGYSAESLLPDITRCVREKKDVKIRALHIFHPDPWLKTRHLKRRIINPSFVRLLETHLPQGTAILLQTDVAELHEYHREVFEQNSKRYKFTDSEKHVQPCFDMYMKDVLTDRHRAVLNNGGEIFRSVLLEK